MSLTVLVVLLGVGGLLAVGGVMWLADVVSQRMLFRKFPPNYELTPEYSLLRADDGVTLAMRYWRNPEARYTVLFLHGNREDLGTVSEYLPRYHEAGFSVMALDYRGYGHSGGYSTEASSYVDTERALTWLEEVQHTPRDRVIVIGFSLGGGPAVEMAVRHRLAGLILIAAFASAYRVKTRWVVVPGDKFENEKKMSRVRCPLLLVHGTLDRTVPVWHGKLLFAAAREPKMNLFVEGGYHSNVIEVAGARYWEAVRAFTETLSR
jgi:alpha-beta hydrolase superfamily lysophospholipase